MKPIQGVASAGDHNGCEHDTSAVDKKLCSRTCMLEQIVMMVKYCHSKCKNDMNRPLILVFNNPEKTTTGKHPVMLTRGVTVMHDNTPPHVAHTIQGTLHSMH